MKFLKERRAQGAFEYILLLAGVLLIVVLAIIILRGSVLTTANNNIAAGANAAGEATDLRNSVCVPVGAAATTRTMYIYWGGNNTCCYNANGTCFTAILK